MLRVKEVLTHPIRKADEHIVIKFGSADAPIKESEGPIVIYNLNQFDVQKISRGTVANDHDAQSSTSAPENFQPTWYPSGLSRM